MRPPAIYRQQSLAPGFVIWRPLVRKCNTEYKVTRAFAVTRACLYITTQSRKRSKLVPRRSSTCRRYWRCAPPWQTRDQISKQAINTSARHCATLRQVQPIKIPKKSPRHMNSLCQGSNTSRESQQRSQARCRILPRQGLPELKLANSASPKLLLTPASQSQHSSHRQYEPSIHHTQGPSLALLFSVSIPLK